MTRRTIRLLPALLVLSGVTLLAACQRGDADKALLEVGGRTMLSRVMEATQGCSPLLLATGRADRPELEAMSVTDIAGDYAGPLAGVAAAMRAMSQSRNGPPLPVRTMRRTRSGRVKSKH